MGSLLAAAARFVATTPGRILASLGISQGTKQVILAAERREIRRFTPQEGTLGPQPTPEQRQEMGEQIAQAHATRGHRSWGGWVAGIAVGIGVGLLLPASVPFAAAAVITGLAGTAAEGVVGAVSGGEPVPGSESPQPTTDGAEVTGQVGSDEPSVQSNQGTDDSPSSHSGGTDPGTGGVYVFPGGSGTHGGDVNTGNSSTTNDNHGSCEEETHGGSGCGGTTTGGGDTHHGGTGGDETGGGTDGHETGGGGGTS